MPVLAFALCINTSAYAQDEIATTPRERRMECFSQQRDYPAEAQRCVGACRISDNASDVQANRCLDAYDAFRKASGQSRAPSQTLVVESFAIDYLVATFSVKNGRLNRFKLVGESSHLAKRAAKVCAFKLPASQSADPPQFNAQFRDQIRSIRNQGENYAFKLSDISWSEDGKATHYICNIGNVGVVATQ